MSNKITASEAQTLGKDTVKTLNDANEVCELIYHKLIFASPHQANIMFAEVRQYLTALENKLIKERFG